MKRKQILIYLFITALIFFGIDVYVNPYQKYRLDLSSYNLNSYTKSESAHVIAYGVDASELEPYYLAVRNFLGVNFIDKKVKIYKARPVNESGSIGLDHPHGGYIGIFRASRLFGYDVIIYNGQPETLVHELTHFFYHYLTPFQRDEAFAQLTTNFIGHQLQCRAIISVYQFMEQLRNHEKNQVSTKHSGN